MSRRVTVLGVPIDLGADRRGVDMGPSAIRYGDAVSGHGGLADQLARADVETADAGDLRVPRAEERDADSVEPSTGKAKFLEEIEQVSDRLADRVADTIADGSFPLVLGGDHALAIGSLRGSARDADIGAIWFDAHGDFNTPSTSPSGNVHGMPLAAALGVGEFEGVEWANAPRLREENVALVGLRSLDPAEREVIRDSDVTAFTMSDIDERGIKPVVEDALDAATDGVDGVHVSLDLDWLDPNEAPGVGTPVPGGVTYREAHAALETVADRDREADILRSLELVEVNPILDEHNKTAELATELAASAMGKRIL